MAFKYINKYNNSYSNHVNFEIQIYILVWKLFTMFILSACIHDPKKTIDIKYYDSNSMRILRVIINLVSSRYILND